ncbi:hypothetical protein [Tumebacillus flagellatus]|uniref:Chemotaxis methyl-accepting receptor HlyB-like 4HB MCP domain-containing protein n=1 Tax=Tumebacillus flagellatus TaxID=1157490 RepID=A0A074LH15_9BACL|nr:hypothetical protein [Tumebacillus flagellatus]KEO81521.1 hypothetical protein EL26_20185 [Tumebacillus flagellatus]
MIQTKTAILGVAILALLGSVGTNVYLFNQHKAAERYYLARTFTAAGEDLLQVSSSIDSMLKDPASVSFQMGLLTAHMDGANQRTLDLTSNLTGANPNTESWEVIHQGLDRAMQQVFELNSQIKDNKPLTVDQQQRLKNIRELSDGVFEVFRTSNPNTGDIKSASLQNAVISAKKFSAP